MTSKYIGKLISVNADGPYTDLVSGGIVWDDELVEKQYSTQRTPKYFLGKISRGVKFVTADGNAMTALKKGTVVESAVLTFEGVLASDATALGSSTMATATLTNGVVTDAVALEASTDGAPAEFAVTIMCATMHDGGNTEGTLVISLNGTPPPET